MCYILYYNTDYVLKRMLDRRPNLNDIDNTHIRDTHCRYRTHTFALIFYTKAPADF